MEAQNVENSSFLCQKRKVSAQTLGLYEIKITFAPIITD